MEPLQAAKSAAKWFVFSTKHWRILVANRRLTFPAFLNGCFYHGCCFYHCSYRCSYHTSTAAPIATPETAPTTTSTAAPIAPSTAAPTALLPLLLSLLQQAAPAAATITATAAAATTATIATAACRLYRGFSLCFYHSPLFRPVPLPLHLRLLQVPLVLHPCYRLPMPLRSFAHQYHGH